MSRIVAIIGRPNVGKSTLFNRIIGARKAIVDDRPGVTRDRLYAQAEWTGKSFTLIDTGGYVPASTDLFELAIREQAEIAIDEADAVIFIVDGTAGITPLDEEIAAILRAANKHIHLVVNKIDSDRLEAETAQFYRLGLGDPLAVSALGGRRIGDFLDELTAPFVEGTPSEENDGRLKIAIVGKPNVGKSSLVNALIGQPRHIVTAIPGTTRDSIDSILRYEGEEILLIDTAGLRRKSRIRENIEFYSTLRALKSIDRCDVAVLVVDAEAGVDKQDIRIVEDIVERKRGTLIAGNKWDAVEKDDKTARGYEKAIQALLRKYDYVPILFISALKKQRIFRVIDRAREVHAEQIKRIPTNALNILLQRVLSSRPPSSASGKEIKLKYVTQVKTHPPAFAFFANEPKLIGEDYRRFLERMLREEYGFAGVPLTLYFRSKHSK